MAPTENNFKVKNLHVKKYSRRCDAHIEDRLSGSSMVKVSNLSSLSLSFLHCKQKRLL